MSRVIDLKQMPSFETDCDESYELCPHPTGSNQVLLSKNTAICAVDLSQGGATNVVGGVDNPDAKRKRWFGAITMHHGEARKKFGESYTLYALSGGWICAVEIAPRNKPHSSGRVDIVTEETDHMVCSNLVFDKSLAEPTTLYLSTAGGIYSYHLPTRKFSDFAQTFWLLTGYGFAACCTDELKVVCEQLTGRIDCTATGVLIAIDYTHYQIVSLDPRTGHRSVVAGRDNQHTDMIGDGLTLTKAGFSYPKSVVLCNRDRCAIVLDDDEDVRKVDLPELDQSVFALPSVEKRVRSCDVCGDGESEDESGANIIESSAESNDSPDE